MKNLIKKFTTLFTGVMLSQLLSVLSIPILSRLYNPDDFGELSLFVSLTGVLSLFASLKLNEAIMTSKTLDEKNKIFGALSFFHLFFLVIAILLSLLLIIFDTLEINLFLILLLPFNLVLYSFFVTTGITFIKEDNYKKVSKSQIDRSVWMNLSQFVFSFNGIPFNGLLLGNIIGNLFGSRFLVKKFKETKQYISFSNFKSVLKKYSNFPLYNLPQAVFNNLSSALPHIMLISPFGPTNVGLLYMVIKLVNLPTILISNIITNLYYKNVSDLYNENQPIFKNFVRTITLLLSLSIPIFLVVIFGNDVIITVLGKKWEEAKDLIPWVALWTLSIFVYMPATKTIIVLKLQKYFMYYTILELSIRILILLFGINYYSFIITIKYFSIFNSLSNFTVIILVFICILYKEKRNLT